MHRHQQLQDFSRRDLRGTLPLFSTHQLVPPGSNDWNASEN
jgi:hypothetical protein